MTDESHPTTGRTEGVIHGASRVLRIASMVTMVLMTLFVAADVIGRFFFNMPFKGSTDLVEVMMGIVVFFGMGYCAQEEGHTRVDLLYNWFPTRVQGYLDVITFSASLFVFVLITWQLCARGWAYIMEPAAARLTDLLHIPHVYFIFAAALGSAVLSLEILVHIVRSLARAGSHAG